LPRFPNLDKFSNFGQDFQLWLWFPTLAEFSYFG
jgi:hypothetical protein